MRVPGYCTDCHRIKQVAVSNAGMAAIATGGTPSGVCADCQEKDDARPTAIAIAQVLRRAGIDKRAAKALSQPEREKLLADAHAFLRHGWDRRVTVAWDLALDRYL